MTYLASKNSLIMLLVLLSPLAYSQTEWDAGVSAQVNSGDPIESQLTPDVSATYQHPRFSLQSSASTTFSSQANFVPEAWQSQNQLNWSMPAELITGGFMYGHQETDRLDTDILTVSDNASASISLMIPQSRTLSHQITAMTQYREVSQYPEDDSEDTQVDDRSEDYNYRLILNTSPRTLWQGGIGLQYSDVGQRVANINLSRIFQTPRYSFAVVSALNQTEFDENTAESFTGSASYNYSHERFLFSTSVSRSITDTLDLFEVVGLERPFEQQQYIEADQLSIGVSDIKPTDSLNMSVNYSTGVTQSLIDAEYVSQDFEVTFTQWNAQAVLSFAANAQISLLFSDRIEDESHSQSLTTGIQKTFNSHWNASTTIRDDLLSSSALTWSISVNYRL